MPQGLPRERPWGRRRGAPTPFAPFWRDFITPSPVGRPRTPHRAPTRQKGEETTERHGGAGKARALPPQRLSRPLLFSSFCALAREKSRAWGGVAGLRERAPTGRRSRSDGWPWRAGQGAATERAAPRREAHTFLCLAAAIRRRKAQAARGRSPRSGLTSAHTVPAPAPKTTLRTSTGRTGRQWRPPSAAAVRHGRRLR